MLERYCRQIAVDGFGGEAQHALNGSIVAVVGLGGLGSPVAMYLAAAGVGKLILIDDQRAEESNLNRQVLHWEEDVLAQRMKATSAMEKLQRMNSEIEIMEMPMSLTEENTDSLLRGIDLAIDCLDSFNSRKTLNRFCVKIGVPMVSGGVEGMYGHVTTVIPGSACLECIFPTKSGKSSGVPVLGPVAGTIGCLQATEAIKVLTGVGRPAKGRLMTFDMREMEIETYEIDRNPDCPICGDHLDQRSIVTK